MPGLSVHVTHLNFDLVVLVFVLLSPAVVI